MRCKNRDHRSVVLFILGLFLVSFGHGCSNEDKLSLNITVSPLKVSVGDIIHYSAEITSSARGSMVEWPDLKSEFETFDIIDDEMTSGFTIGGKIFKRKVTLRQFTPGEYSIPPHAVKVILSSGKVVSKKTNAFLISVSSVVDDSLKQKTSVRIGYGVDGVDNESEGRLIETPIEYKIHETLAPEEEKDIRSSLILYSAYIVIPFFCAAIYMFLKKTFKKKPRSVSPHEDIQARIIDMRNNKYWEDQSPREFVFKISSYLSRYIAYLCLSAGKEYNTSELITLLKKSNRFPLELCDRVEKLFYLLNSFKFTGNDPGFDECDRICQTAKDLVSGLYAHLNRQGGV